MVEHERGRGETPSSTFAFSEVQPAGYSRPVWKGAVLEVPLEVTGKTLRSHPATWWPFP